MSLRACLSRLPGNRAWPVLRGRGRGNASPLPDDADPHALRNVPNTHVETPIEALREVDVPTLVAIGQDDARDGDQLAAALPKATLVRLPGDHWSAFTSADFAAAILDWLRNISTM